MNEATATPGPTSPDLYALLLRVRPLSPGTIMPFTGEQVHGALMHWLKGVEPALTTELHDGNKRRLFTVSSLHFPFPNGTFWAERGNVHLPLKPELTYTIRITLLRRDLFMHFYRALTEFNRLPVPLTAAARLPFVQLGKQLFLLEEVTANNDDPSRWCGSQSLVGLVNQVKAERARSLALEFASLTTFKRLAEKVKESDPHAHRHSILKRLFALVSKVLPPDSQQANARSPLVSSDPFWYRDFSLLPFPQLLFGGLARRWEDIAPRELAHMVQRERIERYLQEGGVSIGDYQLSRHQIHFAGFTQHGFVGRCAFHLHTCDDDGASISPLTIQQQLHLLAHLAFYCGVGYKTTMGLGQVRLVSEVHQRTRRIQAEQLSPETKQEKKEDTDGEAATTDRGAK